jgi:hypothetical protein
MNIPVLKKKSIISKGVSHATERLPSWQRVTGGKGFYRIRQTAKRLLKTPQNDKDILQNKSLARWFRR